MLKENRELIVIITLTIAGLLFALIRQNSGLAVFFGAILAGIAVIMLITWIITGGSIEDEQDR